MAVDSLRKDANKETKLTANWLALLLCFRCGTGLNLGEDLDSALKHTVTGRLPSTRFPKHAFSLSTLYNLRISESVK
jgi:hypothetical protein